MTPLTLIISPPPRPKIPLLMEFPVSPELDGPFLITSSRDWIWVSESFPNGTVRAAIRKAPLQFFFREVLERVHKMSKNLEWGSALPATAEGIKKALAHLSDYELVPAEIVVGEKFNTSLVPEDLKVTEALWVPSDWAVVIPADRAFIGTTFDFGEGRYASVIHNAARGLCVLTPESE